VPACLLAPQVSAISAPNAVTVLHNWKDEKKPREYDFDSVFSPKDSQEDVFEDTRHLVRSALDGYNVCVFAYGQTGSGKTFTIYGNEKAPGLTPRGVQELFALIDKDVGKASYTIRLQMLELYQVNGTWVIWCQNCCCVCRWSALVICAWAAFFQAYDTLALQGVVKGGLAQNSSNYTAAARQTAGVFWQCSCTAHAATALGCWTAS